MKVMVIVKATQDSENNVPPTLEALREMTAFNEQLVNAGIMEAGEGLLPSSGGVRVTFAGKDRTVTNGPFAETRELVAGFWIWNVKSMDEAVAWVKRCPNPMPGVSDIEIRKIASAEDFAQVDPNGEISQREKELSKKIEKKKA